MLHGQNIPEKYRRGRRAAPWIVLASPGRVSGRARAAEQFFVLSADPQTLGWIKQQRIPSSPLSSHGLYPPRQLGQLVGIERFSLLDLNVGHVGYLSKIAVK